MTHFILAVHPSLYLSGLDKRHNVGLNLLDRPPKGLAHPVESNSRKRLEVQHDRPVPYLVTQLCDMEGQVNVNQMSRLRDLGLEKM